MDAVEMFPDEIIEQLSAMELCASTIARCSFRRCIVSYHFECRSSIIHVVACGTGSLMD